MSNDMHEQIYNNMNLRETEDLLEIWQTNNRAQWSDDAFYVIEEILYERDVEIPVQDEPAQPIEEDDDFTEAELKIIDDENPPDFYDPFEVLDIVNQLQWAAKAMVALTVIYNLFDSSHSYNIVLGYFSQSLNTFLVYPLTFLLVMANIAIGVLITYLPLRAFAYLLGVLMQMEFNSRKA